MLSRVCSVSWLSRAFTARWPMLLCVYQNSREPNTGSSMMKMSQVIFAVGSNRLLSR